MKSVRSIARYTGLIKKIAGVVLILTAIALQYNLLIQAEAWLASNTGYGDLGNRLEQQLFKKSSSSISSGSSEAATSSISHNGGVPSSLPKIVRAPEFVGLGPWHNSPPFTMASLKGKVVLVDFWTYSCINCIRTLPYIQGYWDKYKDTGKFVLLGVHTPEFAFEQLEKNVSMALKEHGLTYPVAQDNQFGTWTAFANQYWPAKYLIDADGYIRYEHFGEGNYAETDAAIASLLGEIGEKGKDMPVNNGKEGSNRPLTGETYLNERNWPAFANAQGEPSTDPISYTAPGSLKLHMFALDGTWALVDGEHQVLASDSGEIRMHFLAGEINLVLGLEADAKPVSADVMIDGKKVKTITVDRHDLYNLFTGDYGEHELVLHFKGKGVQAYAFTFGS